MILGRSVQRVAYWRRIETGEEKSFCGYRMQIEEKELSTVTASDDLCSETQGESPEEDEEEIHHQSRIRILDKFQTLNEMEDGLEGEFNISKENVGPESSNGQQERWPQEN